MSKMQRKNPWRVEVVLFFVFLVIFSSLASAIRINEAEINPAGSDAGAEWIELYSESEVSTENYKIKNNDGDILNLADFTDKINGYFKIVLEKQWLDNTDEKVFLIYQDEVIDETSVLDDSKNNALAWSFCSNAWEFIEESPGKENLCEEETVEKEAEETTVEEDIPEETTEEKITEETSENPEDISLSRDKTEKDGIIINAAEKTEVIYLNSPVSKNIKTQENTEQIIYKSGTQYIKDYAIYGFTLFCVFVIVVLIIKLKKFNKEKEIFENE